MSKLFIALFLVWGACVCMALPVDFSFGIVPGSTPGNCSSQYSCAGDGDACAGDYTKNPTGCSLTNSTNQCCAANLFCINSTCTTNNMGDSCTKMSDCHSSVASNYNCVSGACQYIYGPGDTCTTPADCANGLNCSGSVCLGYTQGMSCNTSDQCAFGFYCGLSNLTLECLPQVASGGNCATNPHCFPGTTCFNGVCKSLYTVGSGGNCTTGLCEEDYICAANNTCVAVNTDFTSCTNTTTDCNNGSICTCSLFSGKSFCSDLYYNDCTDEASELSSCIVSNNCTNAFGSPNSCAYTNCYSEIKKSNSCGCTASSTYLDSCSYNQYCGGFPVWAIIVIIIVAIILVLAIVLLVFFMMRRRRQYDSI